MKQGLFRNLFGLLGRRPSSPKGPVDAATLAGLSEALLTVRGEASGVAMAREILDGYASLSTAGRHAFLRILAERFGSESDRLGKAIADYQASPGPRTATALHAAAEPRRQELIRRLNLAPGGTLELVRMREDLLAATATRSHPDLGAADADFAHLFGSWFNRGFLVLKGIGWSSPADVLEKIIRYEAVHAIKSWEGLRRRLEPGDRRCFAFFHPRLADEPLIFVEVALTRAIPSSVAPLLSEKEPVDPGTATTAVFYSISSCLPGLKGVSFGNFLVKQVVEELRRDLPSLKTFVTLSPLPGFASWLARERAEGPSGALTPSDREALRLLDHPDWTTHPPAVRLLRPVLETAAARYLLEARTPEGRPLDTVARFHLGNGARLERLNWMGDPSPKGLEEGLGFMVNYLYDPARIERNHELFANRGTIVAAQAVRDLLRPPLARG